MRLTFCFSRNCRPKSLVREPLVRPCWPGLDSNFDLSLIARRALFRNRSVPSRRESLALGPRRRATLLSFACQSDATFMSRESGGCCWNALERWSSKRQRRQGLAAVPTRQENASNTAAFLRPAAVVRHRCHIGNQVDPDAQRGQGAHARLAPRARALDPHVEVLDALLLRCAAGILGRDLGREGRALAR